MLGGLSYANVVATLAPLLALGSSGIAVGAKLLDSGDVKDNPLKCKHLNKDKAVKGADVRNGTIGEHDRAAFTLPAGYRSDHIELIRAAGNGTASAPDGTRAPSGRQLRRTARCTRRSAPSRCSP